jgi:hypothetical protein
MTDAAKTLGDAAMPKAANWSKFARWIEPGNVVHNIDGAIFRVASKVKGPDGIAAFKLANLQGQPVQTPANFYPLSPTMAKFASWLRWIVAYNKDFDEYVKHYIREAGLPVDPRWDWAKWFQKSFFPHLKYEVSEEIKDEAIHNQIFEVLGVQGKLKLFREKVEKFTPETRKLPLDQQVTAYLTHLFGKYEISKANRWIDEIYPSEEVPMYGDSNAEEGEEFSILDTPEFATQPEVYEKMEEEELGHDIEERLSAVAMEVAKFRERFSAWLSKKYEPKVVENLIILFDIVWNHLKNYGARPPRREIVVIWEKPREEGGTGLGLNSLKQYIVRFSELISQYKKTHPTETREMPFIDVIQQVTQERERKEPKRKKQPANASVTASTGLSCELIEWKPGEWYYILEHGNAPKNAWDWREYASAYGPFSSEEEAHDHLSNNHANPGGYSVDTYRERGKDEVMDRLIADAPKNTRGRGNIRNPFYRGRRGSSKFARLIRGDQLNDQQRQLVLNAFVHRWTRENPHRTQVYKCDKCDINEPYVNEESAEGHSHPTIPLQSDEQWLAEHAFHFVKDGSRLVPRRFAEPAFLADESEGESEEMKTGRGLFPKRPRDEEDENGEPKEAAEEPADPNGPYTIYGKYRGKTEEIDTAEDLQSAEYLVGEYGLAYGNKWEVWYEDAHGNRGDMPPAPGYRDLQMMRSMGIRGSNKNAAQPLNRNPFHTPRGLGPCGCADPGCPVHPNKSTCPYRGKTLMYRIDMEDRTGTPMCLKCADDADKSGLFRRGTKNAAYDTGHGIEYSDPAAEPEQSKSPAMPAAAVGETLEALPELLAAVVREEPDEEMRSPDEIGEEIDRRYDEARDRELEEMARREHQGAATPPTSYPKMDCCGSITGYHKPDCPVYEVNMQKTLNWLKNMPKRSSSDEYDGTLDYNERMQRQKDEDAKRRREAVKEFEKKEKHADDEEIETEVENPHPGEEPQLWLEPEAGRVHLAWPEDKMGRHSTFCGKNISAGIGTPWDMTNMRPTSIGEVEEEMKDDVWCPYCLEPELPPKQAVIPHEFYDGIRPQVTEGDTGKLPHAYKEGESKGRPNRMKKEKPPMPFLSAFNAWLIDQANRGITYKDEDEARRIWKKGAASRDEIFEQRVRFYLGKDRSQATPEEIKEAEWNARIDQSEEDDLRKYGASGELRCKHCGKPIGHPTDDPVYAEMSGWVHNPEDGPDAYEYCGDEYGTEAEPAPFYKESDPNKLATEEPIPTAQEAMPPMNVKEPAAMAEPDPGPGSPNAPARAPRVPGMRPIVVGAPPQGKSSAVKVSRNLEDDFIIEGEPQRLGRLPYLTELDEPQPEFNGQITCRHCGDKISHLSAVLMYGHMKDKHPDVLKTAAGMPAPRVPAVRSPQTPAAAPTVEVQPGQGAGMTPISIEMPEEEQPPKHTVPPEIPYPRLHLQGAYMDGIKEAYSHETLRSEVNSPEVEKNVEVLIAAHPSTEVHQAVVPVYEHGHWWAHCGHCGAIWDVVDAAGGDSIEGFNLEEIEFGDESCNPLTEGDEEEAAQTMLEDEPPEESFHEESSTKEATGEQSAEDLTREEWPMWYAIADALGGTVEPFDVYQGPYISVPGENGRLFIVTEDGVWGQVWNEATQQSSSQFDMENENEAVDAALEIVEHPPTNTLPYGDERLVGPDISNVEQSVPAGEWVPETTEADKARLRGLGVVGRQKAADHDRPATESEADYEYARNVGEDNPEKAWILSDRDVWYRNPAYKGPPVPHPEEHEASVRTAATEPTELKRKDIAAMFPGYTLSMRRVDFTDLGRGSAYFLTVKDSAGNKINGRGIYDQDWLNKYNDVFDKLNDLKGQYMYQGLPLIADS